MFKKKKKEKKNWSSINWNKSNMFKSIPMVKWLKEKTNKNKEQNLFDYFWMML